MDENRRLFRLSDTDTKNIDHLAEDRGPIRFLDPRNHIGFDIFDEGGDQPVKEDEREFRRAVSSTLKATATSERIL